MVSLDSPITVVRPHLIEFGVGTAGKLGAWAAGKGYSRYAGYLGCFVNRRTHRCVAAEG